MTDYSATYTEPLVFSRRDGKLTCSDVDNLISRGWKNIFPADSLAIGRHLAEGCKNHPNLKWPSEESEIPVD